LCCVVLCCAVLCCVRGLFGRLGARRAHCRGFDRIRVRVWGACFVRFVCTHTHTRTHTHTIQVYGRTPADGGENTPSSSSWCLVAEAEGAHTADVNCVAWHPRDDTLLASAADDGLVKLWRVAGAVDGSGGRGGVEDMQTA
jgi:WD40 repeat protein